MIYIRGVFNAYCGSLAEMPYSDHHPLGDITGSELLRNGTIGPVPQQGDGQIVQAQEPEKKEAKIPLISQLSCSVAHGYQNEALVSFSEESQFQKTSLFSKLMMFFEGKQERKAIVQEKWPDGIPRGQVSVVESGCDLYVNYAGGKEGYRFNNDVWSLSQLANIKLIDGEYCYYSPFSGEKYPIKKSYLQLAVAMTPEEEGLIGLAMRLMRITVVNGRLINKARRTYISIPNTISNFFDKETAPGVTIDENIHWVMERLGNYRGYSGEPIALFMQRHTCVGFFTPGTYDKGNNALIGTLQVQPASNTRMYEILSGDVKKIINKRWAGHKDDLLNGSIQAISSQDSDSIQRYHDYYSVHEYVMAVYGAAKGDDHYSFKTKEGKTLNFTDAECELAALVTPIENGMLGVCDVIAQLCYLKKLNNEGYNLFLSRMICMARSGYVEGIDDFIRHSVEQVRIIEDKKKDEFLLIGIFAELNAAHIAFQKMLRQNNKLEASGTREKTYMRLSEKGRSSEFDIKQFEYGPMGEEIPKRMIEVKSSIQALLRRLYRPNGKNQFYAYLRECAQYTDENHRTEFCIYIVNTQFSMMQHKIFSRDFFEEIAKEVDSPRLKNLLGLRSPVGKPLAKFSVKQALYLTLFELIDLRDSITDKNINIGLYLWDPEKDDFVKFNSKVNNK